MNKIKMIKFNLGYLSIIVVVIVVVLIAYTIFDIRNNESKVDSFCKEKGYEFAEFYHNDMYNCCKNVEYNGWHKECRGFIIK